MKIYLSLPINTPGYDIAVQRRIAKMWQRYFEAQGHIVSNPFDIYDRLCQFHKDTHRKPPTRSEIMTEDITELITNDTIFFCNGWSNSKGCLEEAELATQYVIIDVIFEKYIKV